MTILATSERRLYDSSLHISSAGAINAYGSSTLLSISGEALFSGNTAVRRGGELLATTSRDTEDRRKSRNPFYFLSDNLT